MPVYRVVIVDEDAAARSRLREILAAAGHAVVAEVDDPAQAPAEIRTHCPDAVLLDWNTGAEAAAALTQESAAVVALLACAPGDQPQMAEAGVTGCVFKPFQFSQVFASLDIAIACHQELHRLRSEVQRAEDALDTRKLVDRAKALLMEAYELSESEAFRRIQSQSMNSRKSMKEVAQELVKTHSRAERH